jgi:hypothetical protein
MYKQARKLIKTKTLILLFCFIGAGCSYKHDYKYQKESTDRIKQIFNEWENDEIKSGHFINHDSCNWEYVTRLKVDGLKDIWSIPSDLNYSFADLNNDSIVDGLVSFCPDQCDGGNGSVWVRFQILIISDKSKYDLSSYLSEGLNNQIGKSKEGFRFIDSISNNEIWGTYYEFKEGDAFCCPSIIKRFHEQYCDWIKNEKNKKLLPTSAQI